MSLNPTTHLPTSSAIDNDAVSHNNNYALDNSNANDSANNGNSNSNNSSSRSQAIEIAVDAHATRLLRAHSPPEACVDSSVGPYVTSILRGAFNSNINNNNNNSNSTHGVDSTTGINNGRHNNNNKSKWSKATIHTQIPDYDSLVELLESQCHMTPSVAKDVIWEIAMVVETGEVSTDGGSSSNGYFLNGGGYLNGGVGHMSFDDNDMTVRNRMGTTRIGYGSGMQEGGMGSVGGANHHAPAPRLGRGYRSQSLGAEREYDVHFLGKFLQEAMQPNINSSNNNNNNNAANGVNVSSPTATQSAPSSTRAVGGIGGTAEAMTATSFLFQDNGGIINNESSIAIGSASASSFSSSLTLALESQQSNDGGGGGGGGGSCLPPLFPAPSKLNALDTTSSSSGTTSAIGNITYNKNNNNMNDAAISGSSPLFPSSSSTSALISPLDGINGNEATITRIGLSSNTFGANASAFAPTNRRSKERHVSFDETHLTTYTYMHGSALSSSSSAPQQVMSDERIASTGQGCNPTSSTIISSEEVRAAPQAQFLPTDYFDPLEGVLNILNLEEEDDDDDEEEAQESVAANVQSKDVEGVNGQMNNNAHTITKTQAQSHDNDFPLCQPISSNNENSDSAPGEKSNNSNDNNNHQNQNTSQPFKKLSRKQQKSSKKEEANDLAAALFFRQTRPRSNSLMDQRHRSSPPLKPLTLSSSSGVLSSFAPSLSNSLNPPLTKLSLGDSSGGAVTPSSSSSATSVTSATTATTNLSTASTNHPPMKNSKNNMTAITPDNAAVINSTTQLLLTLNAHLGHEAASLASKLTDGDLNLAQYLIEAARSDTSSGGGPGHRRRPRICRHELHGTCYRSDCPYSHDLAGVTCLFWLRGRCRGGSNKNNNGDPSCRFLHGFGERLLDGICEDYLVEQKARKAREEEERQKQQLLLKQKEEEEMRKKKAMIPTTNLLQHNEWAAADRLSQSLPNKAFAFFPQSGGSSRSSSPVFGNGTWTASVG